MKGNASKINVKNNEFLCSQRYVFPLMSHVSFLVGNKQKELISRSSCNKSE